MPLALVAIPNKYKQKKKNTKNKKNIEIGQMASMAAMFLREKCSAYLSMHCIGSCSHLRYMMYVAMAGGGHICWQPKTIIIQTPNSLSL